MSEREHELVIVGGGPVGAALAIALSAGGYDVLLLEARPRLDTAADGRTLAMSYGSRLILERLGAWNNVGSATPIRSIHVSQRGGLGRALLAAEDAGLPALGYVIGYMRLQKAMGDALASSAATLYAGASVDDLEFEADRVAIRFQRDDQQYTVASALVSHCRRRCQPGRTCRCRHQGSRLPSGSHRCNRCNFEATRASRL